MLRRRNSTTAAGSPKLALVCLDSKGATITPGETRVQDYMGERGLVLWSGHHRYRNGHSGGCNHCAVLFDKHVATSLNRSDGTDLECLGGASHPAGSVGLVPHRDLYFEVFPQGVAAVRAAMGDRLDWMHDEEVGKFLMAREYDVAKTLTMLENHFKYRSSLGLRADETFDPRLPDCYPVGAADGTDRDGNLLHFTRPGNGGACSPAHFMSNFGLAQMYRWHLYDVEGMKQRLRDCNYSSRRITLLMDLKNVGSISGDAIAFVKKCMTVDTDNSPELLHQTIFINTPSLFRTTFKMFTFFLDERTKQKIQLLGSDYRADLERLIDPKWLPAFAGGSNESWMRYGGAVQLRPSPTIAAAEPHHHHGGGAPAAAAASAGADGESPREDDEEMAGPSPAAPRRHSRRRREAESPEVAVADDDLERHRRHRDGHSSRRSHRTPHRTPVIEVEPPEEEEIAEGDEMRERRRRRAHRDRSPSRRHRRHDGDFLSPRREFAHVARSPSPGYRYRLAAPRAESPRLRARDESRPHRRRHIDPESERRHERHERRRADPDSAELEAIERQQRRERRERRRAERGLDARPVEQEEEVVVEYYEPPRESRTDHSTRRAQRERHERRDDYQAVADDRDRQMQLEMRHREARARSEADRAHRRHRHDRPPGYDVADGGVEFVVDAGATPRTTRSSRHQRAQPELHAAEIVESGALEGRGVHSTKPRHAEHHRHRDEPRVSERRSASRR